MYPTVFDTRHMTTFLAVVRADSYTAAAKKLGYTQPAITQQMKALERTVGTPLFFRAGRRLRLTEAGQTLARHAQIILDDMAVAQEQLTAIARLRTGRVRICAFPSANSTVIPNAIASMAATHPGVRVELMEEEPPGSLDHVMRGECDVALAFTYPESQDENPDELLKIPLLDDPLVIMMPSAHRLTRHRAVALTDLAEERWIAGCPRCRTHFLHECAERGFVPDIAFSTDDIQASQALVAQGLGVALIPELALNFLRSDRITSRTLMPASRREIFACVPREKVSIPPVALLLDALRAATRRRDDVPGMPQD